MKQYRELSKEELLSLQQQLKNQYEDEKAKGLKLDMSRGKPGPEQLDMQRDVFNALTSDDDFKTEKGVDVRNYGILDGIPEAKELIASMVGVAPDNVIVCGNSSLNIMYDAIVRAMIFGILGSTPWGKLDKVKFLCPAPGYDRHFAITEQFGFEMIVVPMTPNGPDMSVVKELVKDPAVKGMWIVPKYSNPLGYSCSDETVRELASMECAASDFRIFWDNAYAVHDLYEDRRDDVLEILAECEKAGNPNRVYEFCSTSKISFPGSGIAAICSSIENIESIKKYMTVQTIGHDKINQLRHVRYFKNADGIRAHMKKHAAIIRPKFEAVLKIFDEELAGLGIGSWTDPNGGYFISFDAMEGCAKEVVKMCKEAGVVLTGAGATYPYKNDPKDSNIRIAPTYPSLEDLKQAAVLFTLCVKLVSVNKLLEG